MFRYSRQGKQPCNHISTYRLNNVLELYCVSCSLVLSQAMNRVCTLPQVTPMLTDDIDDYQITVSRINAKLPVPYYYRRDQHPWLFTWTNNAVFQVRISDCACSHGRANVWHRPRLRHRFSS